MKKIVPDPPPHPIWPNADTHACLDQISRLLRSAHENNYQACEEASSSLEPLLWSTQFLLETAQVLLDGVRSGAPRS